MERFRGVTGLMSEGYFSLDSWGNGEKCNYLSERGKERCYGNLKVEQEVFQVRDGGRQTERQRWT